MTTVAVVPVTAMAAVAVVMIIVAAVATVRFVGTLFAVPLAVLCHAPAAELLPKPIVARTALQCLLLALGPFDSPVQERLWLHGAQDLFGEVFLHLFFGVNNVFFFFFPPLF